VLPDATPGSRCSYRGRFAPSPTGPIHLGSLVAAVGSFLDARHWGGTWLVRMEDLDRTREVFGAADAILSTLDAFGLHWDGPVVYQSTRTPAYTEALDRLRALGLIYPCGCSRSDIATAGLTGPEGPIYPGTCRQGLAPGRRGRSLRLRVPPGETAFLDRIQGPTAQDVARTIGDYVVRRADGIHAYQLTVVVDDAAQGITDVVRGADLTASTPRQVLLQQALGLPSPAYAHLPLMLDCQGRKLSKSDAAAPVDPSNPLPTALLALRHLGQALPPERPVDPAELWRWAIPHWDICRVPTGPHRASAVPTTTELTGG
jgi:glutamyl-Q tRNA(Asp) synthetase